MPRPIHAIASKQCTTFVWQFRFSFIFCAVSCPTPYSQRMWRRGWPKCQQFMCEWQRGKIICRSSIMWCVVRRALQPGQRQSFKCLYLRILRAMRLLRHSKMPKSIIVWLCWRCCWCRRNNGPNFCRNCNKQTRPSMQPTKICGLSSIRMVKRIRRQRVNVPDWRRVIWLHCSIRCRLNKYSVAWHSHIGRPTNDEFRHNAYTDITCCNSLRSQQIWWNWSAKDCKRMPPNDINNLPNYWVVWFDRRCNMCRTCTHYSSKNTLFVFYVFSGIKFYWNFQLTGLAMRSSMRWYVPEHKLNSIHLCCDPVDIFTNRDVWALGNIWPFYRFPNCISAACGSCTIC